MPSWSGLNLKGARSSRSPQINIMLRSPKSLGGDGNFCPKRHVNLILMRLKD